ncbi:hypothetical protein PV325_009468 [Microctonus aethiopoides]|uniref:Uncharacterized protein n=1 Tax=Microctonus aethiopoides TaxID=144406 RepID=A0AA39FW99_9HYME|nr:hypothetical protein PV325_009468 [Microctonus aethiopoides]KAK0073751.1 hypothetical protein PV326_013104 [Microctonus aethiopoides]KAK0176898.1 hypothetical protein PV328_000996 [Microctonus aethiopoides]
MSDQEKSRKISPESDFIEDDVTKDHLTIEVPQLEKTSRTVTPPPSSSSVKLQEKLRTSKETERTTSPANVNSREAKQCIHVTMALTRKREQLTPRATSSTVTTSSVKPQLPQLQVPTFTGDCQAWPEFKQLFPSIV